MSGQRPAGRLWAVDVPHDTVDTVDEILRRPSGKLPANTILLAVEAVPESHAVIAAAADIARRSGAEVLVLSVREREYTRGLAWDRRPLTDITELINGAIFECQRVEVPASGLIRTARSGLVAQAIIDVAHQYGVGTIIIGSSGRSWLGSLVFSSITAGVVRLSDLPVLVVPTRAPVGDRQETVSPVGATAAPKR